MNDSITICIVNYNSSDFIINTLYCLERLTKNDYKIIIRDNNSRLKDYLKLERKIQKYSNVELYRVEDFNYLGSMAHGIALNDLVNRIDTKYGVILDADCTFLYKNWDEILINEINKEYPIIGTQNLDRGTKPVDFPLMYAIFFYSDILKKLKIDFRPKDVSEAKDIKTTKDTGYELREKFLENGYKGKLLLIKSTRDYKLGPFNKVICGEFYLEGRNEIFASHFGRGSTLGSAKYFKGWKRNIYGIPVIGKKILKFKGKKEKKRWIKICTKIVDKN